MPTRAAPAESRPRIAPARSATRRSASGSEGLMGLGRIEEALQDDGRGHRVDIGLAALARASLAQLRFRLRAAERLVHEDDGKAKALAQPPCEALRQARRLV